jgi:UDP-N-acetylmuramyl pentapeptide synthase
VGRYAKEKGIGMLFALGSATPDAVKAFGPGAEHFDAVEELARIKMEASTILVKGSRFMRMERVVAALTGEKGEVH